jgi:hypothetical protein
MMELILKYSVIEPILILTTALIIPLLILYAVLLHHIIRKAKALESLVDVLNRGLLSESKHSAAANFLNHDSLCKIVTDLQNKVFDLEQEAYKTQYKSERVATRVILGHGKNECGGEICTD